MTEKLDTVKRRESIILLNRDFLKKIKNKRSIHYIIIIIIGLIISIPFLWLQIKSMDDGYIHLLRVIGLDNAIDKGKFPFLVFPYFCNNWGYSMTAFYPPIVTYIPYFFGILLENFVNGLKLFATLTTVLSGIFMYNFIYEVTKKKGIALFSAIIYMIFPYKLEDLYTRYATGEFTAFVFMPIIFQELYNLLNGDKKRHYYIAIGATGLLLTHTISTEYTAIFCLIYILLNLKAFLKKDVIIKCIINVSSILLMSTLYILPMLEFINQAEYSIFSPIVMGTNGESVFLNAIEPWQLFTNSEKDKISFVIGMPIILMLLSGFFSYRKLDKKVKDFYIISLIFGIISIMMSTKLFPWKILPDFLCTIQFPWRMIGFAIMFFTPVCAMNIYYLVTLIKKKWIKNLIYIVIIILLMIFTVNKLMKYTVENSNLDKQYELSIIENPKVHYFCINREYMPFKAIIQMRRYLLDRGDTTKVISGQAIIENENKNALHLDMKIKDASDKTELELPFLFYPGYTVKLEYESKEILLEAVESDYGFLKITIPEDIEEGTIIVDYTATTLEKVSYIISLVAIIGFAVYIIKYRRKFSIEK